MRIEPKVDTTKSLRVRPPRGSSPGWPGWICKNSCGKRFDEAGRELFPSGKVGKKPYIKCPDCKAPLIRWVRYEEKKT